MPEKFRTMKMVAHHKYIVKDKLIDANRILEEVKKVIDSRNFPDIQTVIEEVEFDKKMKSSALIIKCFQREMNDILVIFRVRNFGEITIGAYYFCIRGADSELDAEVIYSNIKERMSKTPYTFEYFCAFELLVEVGWNGLQSLFDAN